MLIIHIFFAITAVIIAAVNYFKLDTKLIAFTQGLSAVTIISGLSLIFITSNNIAHVCLSGLVFIAIISSLIYSTKIKLAKKFIRK